MWWYQQLRSIVNEPSASEIPRASLIRLFSNYPIYFDDQQCFPPAPPRRPRQLASRSQRPRSMSESSNTANKPAGDLKATTQRRRCRRRRQRKSVPLVEPHMPTLSATMPPGSTSIIDGTYSSSKRHPAPRASPFSQRSVYRFPNFLALSPMIFA
jgi:hypothetical protein